jgi:RsiW-degrading membrane proteinase PrsW (M82 family)
VRLAGHLIMGGVGGFGAGLLVMRSRSTAWCIPACWTAAAGLHTAWNIAAFDAQSTVKAGLPLLPWHTALPMAVMIAGMGLYRWLMARGAALTRRHLHVCDLRTRRCPPHRDAA